MSLKTLFAFCVAFFGIAVASSQKTLYASAPADRGAYYVRGKNVYNYGYNTGDGIAKVEARHADGSVTGSYRYFDANGNQVVRSYIADDKGFRVLGNVLPVAPETPALGVLDEETLYGATEGTGELSKTSALTSAFLLNNHLGAASNRISPSTTSKRNAFSYEHREIMRQQDDLIKQYERQLAQLKSQRERLWQQYSQPEPFERRGSDPSDSVNNFGGVYFYHDNKRNYDFPAGFSYANSNPVTRSVSDDILYIDDGSGSSKVSYRPLYRRRTDNRKAW